MDLMKIESIMFRALIKNDIQAVAKAAYEILELPFIVVDSDYTPIAQFPEGEIDDYVWDFLLQNFGPDRKSYEIFSRSQIIAKGYSSEMPFYVDGGYFKDKPRIIGSLRADNEVIGYTVTIVSHTTQIDATIIAIDTINKSLAIALERMKYFEKHEGNNKAILLQKLLEGSIESATELEAWLQSLGVDIHPPFQLIVIEHFHKQQSNRLLELKRLIKNKYDHLKPLIREQRIYFLLNRDDLLNTPGFSADAFASFLRTMPLKAGMSALFDDLLETSRHYQQAELALLVARKSDKQHVSQFTQDVFKTIVAVLEFHYEPSNIKHPALKQLHEYDGCKNTDYYNTLKIYVENFKNSGKTAAQLHIHRNSLLYRLQVIQDLTGIDFEDGDDFVHLYLSFAIYTL